MRRTRTLWMALAAISVSAGVGYAGGETEASGGGGAGDMAVGASVMTPEGRWDTLADYEAASGTSITSFGEAPMLADMVAAGDLPPVAERIGDEPLVVSPREGVGQYGGVLRVISMDVDWWAAGAVISGESMLERHRDDPLAVMPNIAKNWEFSDDFKTLTLALRTGMKWSDGDPFDTEDIEFWYEALTHEADLWAGWGWSPGGEIVDVTIVDDATVRYEFAVPWPGALYHIAFRTSNGLQGRSFTPAHYLKQFHIDHNPDANKLAKEAGFEEWWQYYNDRATFSEDATPNADLPVLGPFVLKESGPDFQEYTRNAYYWKIDTVGNQLPYLDGHLGVVAEQPELRVAKVLSGEPDVAALVELPLHSFPVLARDAEKLGYHVRLEEGLLDWPATAANLLINHTVDDAVLRQLFADKRFKRALSVAINRDEINQLVYMGVTTPTQATLPTSSPFWEARFADNFVRHDPDLARELLDEIGLQTDSEGFRLRPDNGKRLELVINVSPHRPEHGPAVELVADHLGAAGVKTHVNHTVGGEMWDFYADNSAHISFWGTDEADPARVLTAANWWSTAWFWGRRWHQWFESDGVEGEEPPADVQTFVDIWKRLPHITDRAEQNRVGKQALELLADNLWWIGIVSQPAQVRVVRTSLRNYEPNDGWWDSYRTGFVWYFDDPARRAQ